ncbi:hypothetical protein EON64_12120 [archaeon]|nr:MAG: hypothetical protein EON64_12120 [archaeon]
MKRYKLVFPNLTQSSSGEGEVENTQLHTHTHTQTQAQGMGANTIRSNKNATGLGRTVSSSVAPSTMFMKNKGFNNADLTEQVQYVMPCHTHFTISHTKLYRTACITHSILHAAYT